MHVCLTIFTLKGNFININHFSNIIARIQLTFHSIVWVSEREREREREEGVLKWRWVGFLAALRRKWIRELGLLKRTKFSQIMLQSMEKENGAILQRKQVWEKLIMKLKCPLGVFDLLLNDSLTILMYLCGSLYIWNVLGKLIIFCWIQVFRGVERVAGFDGWIIWGLISREVTFHLLKRTSLLGFTSS